MSVGVEQQMSVGHNKSRPDHRFLGPRITVFQSWAQTKQESNIVPVQRSTSLIEFNWCRVLQEQLEGQDGTVHYSTGLESLRSKQYLGPSEKGCTTVELAPSSLLEPSFESMFFKIFLEVGLVMVHLHLLQAHNVGLMTHDLGHEIRISLLPH